MEEQQIKMYRLRFMNYNLPAFETFPKDIYVDDIEEFAQKFKELEHGERYERFLRSKNGEIVSDYREPSAEYNIVQEENVVILAQNHVKRNNIEMTALNTWRCASIFYFDEIEVDIRWIKSKGKFYKLAKAYGKGFCEKIGTIPDEALWLRRKVCGNQFWKLNDKDITVSVSETKNTFKDVELEALAWQTVGRIDEPDEIDLDALDVAWLTDEEIIRLFEDITGDM